ncbi:MAG: hypothetical protein ACLQG5_05710 [Methanobacterium sp.]
MKRIYATIALGLGWLLFIALWLFYLVAQYSILQNIAIFIISIVIVAAIAVALWVPWAMKQAV